MPLTLQQHAWLMTVEAAVVPGHGEVGLFKGRIMSRGEYLQVTTHILVSAPLEYRHPLISSQHGCRRLTIR